MSYKQRARIGSTKARLSNQGILGVCFVCRVVQMRPYIEFDRVAKQFVDDGFVIPDKSGLHGLMRTLGGD